MSYRFRTVEEYRSHSEFHNFVHVSFESWGDEQLPPLPPELQILVFERSRVKVFPTLPPTMREVHAKTGWISAVPDLSQLRQLEVLDLEDHHIEAVARLPMSLRTLNLSYNKLRALAVPDSVASLNLAHNFFDEDPTVPPGCTVDRTHMHSEEYLNRRARPARVHDLPHDRPPSVARPPSPLSQGTIYANAQNVHAESVQAGVSKSVQVLSFLCADLHLPADYVDQVLALCTTRRGWQWFRRWWPARSKPPPLRAWCGDPTISSKHGVTFGALLQMVWAVVRTHKDSATLREILAEELKASVGHCFVGRFTRVLNVLTGFVDGVGVGISEREQMQSRIAEIVRRGEGDVRTSVAKVLDEFEVFDEGARDAWLDAV